MLAQPLLERRRPVTSRSPARVERPVPAAGRGRSPATAGRGRRSRASRIAARTSAVPITLPPHRSGRTDELAPGGRSRRPARRARSRPGSPRGPPRAGSPARRADSPPVGRLGQHRVRRADGARNSGRAGSPRAQRCALRSAARRADPCGGEVDVEQHHARRPCRRREPRDELSTRPGTPACGRCSSSRRRCWHRPRTCVSRRRGGSSDRERSRTRPTGRARAAIGRGAGEYDE